VTIEPLDNFLFLITPPLNNISKSGSLPLFNRFSNSKALDNAYALINGLACFPFHTNIIYSYILDIDGFCYLYGKRNDSR
jgi:hypothetical protein